MQKEECICSRERIENGLMSIGVEELTTILEEDGKAEIVCNYCDKKYYFSKDELQNLIDRIKYKN